MSKLKRPKISKAYLPFLLFDHKECDRLWKLNKNYSYSQNHKRAEAGRNLWRLPGATAGCPDLYPVSIQEHDPLELFHIDSSPLPGVVQLQGVTGWGPDQPQQLFHNVPQVSPRKAAKLPKQQMRSENRSILLPAAGNCSLFFFTTSYWCFCLQQV